MRGIVSGSFGMPTATRFLTRAGLIGSGQDLVRDLI